MCYLTWDEVQYFFFKTILTQIYGPIIKIQSRPGADPDFLKRGANRGTQTQRLNFIENIISDRRRKK